MPHTDEASKVLIKELDTKVTEVQKLNESLSKQVKELQDKNSELTQKLSEEKVTESQKEDLTAEVQKLQESLSDVTKKFEELTKTHESLTEEHKIYTEFIDKSDFDETLSCIKESALYAQIGTIDEVEQFKESATKLQDLGGINKVEAIFESLKELETYEVTLESVIQGKKEEAVKMVESLKQNLADKLSLPIESINKTVDQFNGDLNEAAQFLESVLLVPKGDSEKVKESAESEKDENVVATNVVITQADEKGVEKVTESKVIYTRLSEM